MKYATLCLLYISLFTACGQGEERMDNADGKNGKNYTDESTVDSTRIGQDSVLLNDSSKREGM